MRWSIGGAWKGARTRQEGFAPSWRATLRVPGRTAMGRRSSPFRLRSAMRAMDPAESALSSSASNSRVREMENDERRGNRSQDAYSEDPGEPQNPDPPSSSRRFAAPGTQELRDRRDEATHGCGSGRRGRSRLQTHKARARGRRAASPVGENLCEIPPVQHSRGSGHGQSRTR